MNANYNSLGDRMWELRFEEQLRSQSIVMKRKCIQLKKQHTQLQMLLS